MAYATNYTPPGTTLDQRFFHTCTGSEGDTFAIVFPAARHDTNYVAVVTLASSTASSQYLCNAPPSGYTTTQCTVICGNPPAAGDVLAVVVTEIA